MSEETQNTLPLPSDRTLTTDYVALQPGNYKARTDLTPYKGKNLSNNQILDYKPESPFGIGDALSVVYVYPQGTIEIIGNVYCWNKLVKPGIYSRYEKIRYLNNEVVLPRVDSNVFQHHASYDKTIRVPNRFVSKNTNHAEPIIQYHYVDFNDQIVSTNGDKVYPIPVLGGTLTLYPDGTFKTNGVVVKSADSTLVDEYGYLGDSNDYGTLKLFYDDITKDDINPKNVYKLISENEDGSITYGAIESNQTLTRQRWIPLPKGIIPINDGRVTIGTDGLLILEGTVITEQGHLILPSTAYYRHLYTKDTNGNLIANPDMVDTTTVYNPKIMVMGDAGWETAVLDIADGKKAIYEYHMDNYTVTYSEEGPTVTYLPMDGWNVFSSEPRNKKYNMAYLAKFVDNTLITNKDKYPWWGGQVKIGGFYLLGKVRPSLTSKTFTYYPVFDHRCFWHPTNISGIPIPYNQIEYLTAEQYQARENEWVIEYDRKEQRLIDNKFVPYRSLKTPTAVSRVSITDDTINTVGHVVWKRNDKYYSIYGNQTSELITDWPDIQEVNGEYEKLFTALGYFDDEPIFISETGEGADKYGNYVDSIDGIRRQEPGVFKIVTRNITHYLTTLEKTLIDNHFPDTLIVIGDYDQLSIDIKSLTKKNHQITSTDTNLTLEYHAYRFAEVYPYTLSIKNTLFASKSVMTDLLRVYRYRRDEELTSPYWNVASVGSQYNGGHHFFTTKSLPISYNTKDNVRLIRTAPNTTTYKDYHNVEFSEHHWGYYQEPDFRVTDKVILSEAKPIVTSSVGVNTQYYYRSSDDTKYITGSFTLSRNERYMIPVTLSNKYGYIEVWYDDPFDEINDQTNGKRNVKRIKLRRDRSIEPVILVYPDYVDNYTSKLIGTGEPRAMLYLTNDKDPNTTILTKRVDNDGGWVMNELPNLVVGDSYTITQVDEFGVTSTATFVVERHKYKEGDYITVQQLMSWDTYAYPVNLRNVNNLAGEPNLIDSSLSFDVNNNTFTINGLFVDRNGEIFKEGTYELGTTPPHYKSKVLGITTLNFEPQYRNKGNDVYKFSRHAYIAQANQTHHANTTHTATIKVVDEDWVVPKVWVDDAVKLMRSLTAEQYTARYGTQFTLAEMTLLAENFKTYLNNLNYKIGRFQNKLVFDDPYTAFRNSTSTLAYYVYQNNGYVKEGYTFESLIRRLRRKAAWWRRVPFTGQANYDIIFRHFPIDQFSYVYPKGLQLPYVNILNDVTNLKNGDKIVGTPESYTTAYSKSLYEFENWDEIVEYRNYNNEPNKWYYYVNYGYTLDNNYDDMATKMSDDVLQHWTNKGVPPSMFVFGDYATGRVVYSRDGETVTIYGRVKIAGKYTRNITQSALPKDQIAFLPFCPHSYYPGDESGVVELLDNDHLRIEGFVLWRVVDENCNPVPITPTKDIYANLDQVRIISPDPNEKNYLNRTRFNDIIIEYTVSNVDEEDLPYIQIQQGGNGTYNQFGMARRMYENYPGIGSPLNNEGDYYGFGYGDSGSTSNNPSPQCGILANGNYWPLDHRNVAYTFTPKGMREGRRYGTLVITAVGSPIGDRLPNPGTYTSANNFEYEPMPHYTGNGIGVGNSGSYGENCSTFSVFLAHPDKRYQLYLGKPIIVRTTYVNRYVTTYTGG